MDVAVYILDTMLFEFIREKANTTTIVMEAHTHRLEVYCGEPARRTYMLAGQGWLWTSKYCLVLLIQVVVGQLELFTALHLCCEG